MTITTAKNNKNKYKKKKQRKKKTMMTWRDLVRVFTGNAECHHYQPGDVLSADVVLVLASALRVPSIAVELRGEASVSWKIEDSASTSAVGRRNTTTTYRLRSGGARRQPLRPAAACSRWYQASIYSLRLINTIVVKKRNVRKGIFKKFVNAFL